MPLIINTSRGLYCPQAKIYIDPHRKVSGALITHPHADHAIYGHQHYLCTSSAAPFLRHRLGMKASIQSLEYGEKLLINGVQFTFHPAGHIIGSAQVRVEYKGEVWVVSGDYKCDDDGISEPFEPVQCNHFVTECTFGQRVFDWPDQHMVYRQINDWWKANAQCGILSALAAYSLGKAQRIISHLDTNIGPIYTYRAIHNINAIVRNQGITLPKTFLMTNKINRKDLENAMLLIPPRLMTGRMLKKLQPCHTAIASGWMSLEENQEKADVHSGFILSDHADWKGLITTIESTGAENIYLTHGDPAELEIYLINSGYKVTIF